MKVKFNKYERVAGIFVGLAILGSIFVALSVAVKQGWFEKKYKFNTVFENADGVHPGTYVQMAGLRAGSVDDVELLSDNKIKVHFYVLGKFKDRIKEDSVATLVRPFIIGERVLEVSVGSESKPHLSEQISMKSAEAIDIMTLMSGKNIGGHLEKIAEMMENLRVVMEAFLDKHRTAAMVKIFDRLEPLLLSFQSMSREVTKLSKQATKDDYLPELMKNLALTTKEINLILPEMNKQNPNLASDLAKVTQNLAILTHDFKALGTAVNEVGPELPSASRRAVEALNETVVLLKAMQKSFLLKGNVEDVKEEESRRIPASK